MIDQVVYYFEPVIALKKLNFTIKIPEFCTVLGDNNTLKIIFRNIFDNAVKYTAEGHKINVYTKEDDENIHVLIENPIPKKEIAGITSTGLGHQLCKEFAIKNEGAFKVTTTSSHIQISLSLKKSHDD